VPGADIRGALDRMLKADKTAKFSAGEEEGCFRRWICCGVCVNWLAAYLQIWSSTFGFSETQEEVDMLLERTALPRQTTVRTGGITGCDTSPLDTQRTQAARARARDVCARAERRRCAAQTPTLQLQRHVLHTRSLCSAHT
jgi:hypothetical protein